MSEGPRCWVSTSLTACTARSSRTASWMARTTSGSAASPISRPWVSIIRKIDMPISTRPMPIEAQPSSTGMSSRCASTTPVMAITRPISAATSSTRMV